MSILDDCRALSDSDLEQALAFLAEREKHGLTKLLAHLAEYDRRQLCVKLGHSSLYQYCLQVLHYDEGGAFRRIRAARVARRWPEVLGLLESGALHLTALVVLHPVLTDANRKELFTLAAGKTRRELDALVAARLPRPAQADFSRRLPVPGGWSVAVAAPVDAVEAVSSASSPLGPNVPSGGVPAPGSAVPVSRDNARPWEWQAVVHTALDRVRIGFDAGIGVLNLIDRARQVLRHKYPEGRLEDVVKEALEALLDRRDPQRRLTLKPSLAGSGTAPSAAAGPASSSSFVPRGWRAGRYIPAWVKRAVWERDEGRCAWRFADGTPCGSKDWIEYDHVRPFAKGGRSDTPRNIRLLCRVHNQLAAAAQGLSAKAPGGK